MLELGIGIRKRLCLAATLLSLLVTIKLSFSVVQDVQRLHPKHHPMTPSHRDHFTSRQQQRSSTQNNKASMQTKLPVNNTQRENIELVNFDTLKLFTQVEGINPHPFSYKHNNMSVCNKKDILVLVFIHTSPQHYMFRKYLRETWISVQNYKGENLRTIFLLGATQDEDLQKGIDEESRQYGDVIQEDFIDAYKNLSLKFTMGLKWVQHFCPQARFIVKLDDVVVDPFLLIHNLTEKNGYRNRNNLIYCRKAIRIPLREKSISNKWFVSKDQYPYKRYPRFCQGFAVIFSSDVAERLYNISLVTKPFWIDDVWMTGILRDKLYIPLQTSKTGLRIARLYIHIEKQVGIGEALFYLADTCCRGWHDLWSKIKSFHYIA